MSEAEDQLRAAIAANTARIRDLGEQMVAARTTRNEADTALNLIHERTELVRANEALRELLKEAQGE